MVMSFPGFDGSNSNCSVRPTGSQIDSRGISTVSFSSILTSSSIDSFCIWFTVPLLCFVVLNLGVTMLS